MVPVILPRPLYLFLFCLLGLAYLPGLFVTLMDNDSAHHANIALHMYLTGDYVRLIDNGRDYLDKPHLHFWLCALSYHLFGVTTFAYKFPSFLFTLLGTWSTYRLGKALYDEETGRLAALMAASAFAYMLANNDVRMDAILTACVAFSSWQLVELVRTRRWIHVAGSAWGLALGFATKGHIAVFTPAIGTLFYILYTRKAKDLLDLRWLVLLLLFALFISPVVYCYYLQYNLHPEIQVRGRDHINGVSFILFGQSLERFQGDQFGGDARNDYLFFFHSFLWAFAPWSLLTYLALAERAQGFLHRSREWFTPSTVLVLAGLLTFSGFKLPHYLNIIFPAAAVLTAAWFRSRADRPVTPLRIQVAVVVLLLMLSAVLNGYFFPLSRLYLLPGVILLLAAVIYFFKSPLYNRLQKAICLSVSAMALTFFLLNTSFYPQLLRYQGGNQLAAQVKGTLDPADVYFWKDIYSSSFCFYTASLRQPFSDSVFAKGRPVWLLIDRKNWPEVSAHYHTGTVYRTPDYEITRLQFAFVNPSTRARELTEMQLVELKGIRYLPK